MNESDFHRQKTLVFISQPMKGLSREGIERERKLIEDDLPELLKTNEIEVIQSLLDDKTVQKMHPLYCLGMSLQLLSAADVAVFAEGWEEARGCRIEHECALQYGIKIIDLGNGQIENTRE